VCLYLFDYNQWKVFHIVCGQQSDVNLLLTMNNNLIIHMFASDRDSERAADIQDYQRTCSEFIIEISGDYKNWVDKYDLSQEEARSRKTAIENVVKTTNEWIINYSDTIKKVDISMNDGINKMAEFTAGYPFKFEIFVNQLKRYTFHQLGKLKVNVKATPNAGRLTRIGNYHKDQLFLLNSSCQVDIIVSQDITRAVDVLDDYIIFDATQCHTNDLISFTIVVEEVTNNSVLERRGYSTIVMLR
jgi:ribosomal protein S11